MEGCPIVTAASSALSAAEAAREAAHDALDRLEGEAPGWVLAFAGGRHSPEVVLATLSRELGGIPIVGGCAVGTITGAGAAYSGYECALALFPARLPAPRILVEEGLERDEVAVGRRLGARLRREAGEVVLLFYDSVRAVFPQGPELHVGSRLLDGLYQGLGGAAPHLVGAGLVGDFPLTRSALFDGVRVLKHAAVAVVLPPAFRATTAVMHGCRPASAFLEITRAEGARVLELDGRPAGSLIRERLGWRIDSDQSLCLAVTLGRKVGDPFEPYREDRYINRLILSDDPRNGAVTLFEADFRSGDRVQLMARDNRTMMDSARNNSARLLASLAGPPLLAFYVDCAGRAAAFNGADEEEADQVRRALEGVPLLGCYTGVEIAPLLGRSRPLDWTGVLTLLTVEDHGPQGPETTA